MKFFNWFNDLFFKKVVREPAIKVSYYNLPEKEDDIEKDYEMKYITVHCTATPEGREVTVNDIDRWHKARGWSGIGYHWVIYLDGSIHKGRPENKTGAHVGGYNKNNLGITYVGGCDSNMKPKDTRTDAQKKALEGFLKEKRKQYPDAIIQGHRDFPKVKKACPSFSAKEEYKHI